MYIYFEDKIINFITADSPCDGYDRCTELGPGERIGIAKVLQNLENIKRLVIKAPDPQFVFDDFCNMFTRVDAAGGLVSNPAGETLILSLQIAMSIL